MRRRLLCTGVAVVSVFLVTRHVCAHHAFASAFDPDKVVTLTGRISELSWTNPHVAVKVAVRNAAGRSELWTVYGDNPAALERNGWNRRALVVGQQLTVCGYHARAGRNEMSGEHVALAGGVGMLFATTNVKACLINPSQAQRANPTSRNPIAPIRNPVGAMGNPIPPMGNPIGPVIGSTPR